MKGIVGNEQKSDSTAVKTGTQDQNTGASSSGKSDMDKTIAQQADAAAPSLSWSKYDFVPGDKIIFEDNLIGEENGEFPSRMGPDAGDVENAQFSSENVIMFRG